MTDKTSGNGDPDNAGPGNSGPEKSEPGNSAAGNSESGNFQSGDFGPGLAQGFEVAAGIGLGVLIGMWWDRHHASSPWGLLVGLLLGCVAGTYLLIKDSMRANKD